MVIRVSILLYIFNFESLSFLYTPDIDYISNDISISRITLTETIDINNLQDCLYLLYRYNSINKTTRSLYTYLSEEFISDNLNIFFYFLLLILTSKLNNIYNIYILLQLRIPCIFFVVTLKVNWNTQKKPFNFWLSYGNLEFIVNDLNISLLN